MKFTVTFGLLLSCVLSFSGEKVQKFIYPSKAPKDSAELFDVPKKLQQFALRDMAISPAGDEIFFTLESSKNVLQTIIHIKKENGEWKCDVASFSGTCSDLEPAFSPDGNTLYFVSNRPFKKGDKLKDFDIWKVKKENGIWSEPENLGLPVNTEENEFYPSVTNSGNLYFTAAYKDAKGKEDIYVSKFIDGKYIVPESLSDSVNTAAFEFNAYVSPD